MNRGQRNRNEESMDILKQMCEDERIAVKFILPDQATDILKPDTSLRIDGADPERYILLNPNKQKWEKKLVWAHELAHHIFGHLDDCSKLGTEEKENEARIFAAVFTALLIFKQYDGKE